ncbi:sensor histidine kinase [Paraflavitalea pollutisoli]|uniref:sensor histidine kinase n=1 Tax=Paraflavitalea pollutisoli TaxID=3034143 RepID=UPI0023EB3C7A|nr:HAMP domain-containing sensor histidine kinase [Paraflavitalea sp. H1-2-19X]
MRSKFAGGIYVNGMRSSTLRWIILLATFLVALIAGVQLFWLNKVYSFEHKTFNTNVVKSIRGLYEDLDIADSPANHLQDLIEHPAPDYFLFRVGAREVPYDSLVFYLKHELNDFDVLTDAYISLYSARTGKYVAQEYVAAAAARYDPSNIALPLYPRPHDYVLLYFPHRNKYVLAQMNFWFISTAILFIVLIGLAVILFYFYRQKFLAEVQKDFVNNFTHEFKTPLAVMKISAEVLLQDKIVQQPERLFKYAHIIQHQTAHLQSQVERLLHIASTDGHKIPVEMEQVPVKEIIEQAVAKVQPLVENRNALVEIQNLEEPDFEILADRVHLELAVVNLLENALKYSTNPHVIISTGQEDGHLFISVKDNGIGIEKKYQKDLFKKFYRVPTGDVHNVKGFGLGLNFVKRIIDAHHGSIRVNSLPGIGTEFKMLFPL